MKVKPAISVILALLGLTLASGTTLASVPTASQSPAPTSTPQPEYIVVLGREDKHTIVRYDINSPIFKQPYINVKNPEPLSGSWSMNFRDFLRENELPEACKKAFGKKKFFSNVAIDANGDCQHWEFNQGHIYKLREDSFKNIEEVYTYSFLKNSKKFCLRFTSFEKGKEGAYEQTTKFTEHEGDPDCVSLVTFYVENHHYQMSQYSKDEFSIVIEDPSRNKVVRLRQDSWIAKNPIIDQAHEHKNLRISLNFAALLKTNQYPTNKGCAEARSKKVQVNYMYGDGIHCAYGLFTKVPLVIYHEETEAVPFDYVFMMLNSFQGHELFVDFVGMNVLHGATSKFVSRVFRDTENKNQQYKIADFLYIYVPRSEYVVEQKTLLHKFLYNLSKSLLFVIPAFSILFFNNDYKDKGVYLMQFGIVFDMICNCTWAVIDWLNLERALEFVYLDLTITVYLAYLLSLRKRSNLIRIWQIWVFIDYALMALLMQDKGTVFLSLTNIAVFLVMSTMAKNMIPELSSDEIWVSLAISLSLLNQFGNIIYYTSSLNRVFFLLEGLKIPDLNPAAYYLGYGMVMTLLSVGRLFLNEFLPWNREARFRVSNIDEDEGVSFDETRRSDARSLELQKKIAQPDESMTSYDTEDA